MNWVSMSVAVVFFIACVVFVYFYRRKLKRLDGLHGIIPPDKEHIEEDDDTDLGMKGAREPNTADSSGVL